MCQWVWEGIVSCLPPQRTLTKSWKWAWIGRFARYWGADFWYAAVHTNACTQGYSWTEDKEFCEEYGRMQGADPSAVSDRARKRGIMQV